MGKNYKVSDTKGGSTFRSSGFRSAEPLHETGSKGSLGNSRMNEDELLYRWTKTFINVGITALMVMSFYLGWTTWKAVNTLRNSPTNVRFISKEGVLFYYSYGEASKSDKEFYNKVKNSLKPGEIKRLEALPNSIAMRSKQGKEIAILNMANNTLFITDGHNSREFLFPSEIKSVNVQGSTAIISFNERVESMKLVLDGEIGVYLKPKGLDKYVPFELRK